MPNRAFWRALHGLTHPLILLAIVLLLVNDHWLRFAMPSWWTGKLGDFAWLLFAPFIAAAALAWLVPKRLPQQERIVGLTAFIGIGAWFALAKTIPTVHALTTSTLDSLVGWRGSLRLDATDLVTLPALLIGWRIWQTASHHGRTLAPLGWVATALGIMGTLATSCLPVDYGVTVLCQQDDSIVAVVDVWGQYEYRQITTYMRYGSEDGGLSWKQAGTVYDAKLNDCVNAKLSNKYPMPRESWTLRESAHSYRFVPGEGIYLAKNGQTEKLDFDLSAITHDIHEVYHEGLPSLVGCGGQEFVPGPWDALIDKHTGNLVLAMGLDGVLMKSANGAWHWVSVGQYRYEDFNAPSTVFNFLTLEIALALALLPLLPPTFSVSTGKLGCFSTGRLLLAWLIWLANVLIGRKALYILMLSPFGIPVISLAAALIAYSWRSVAYLFRQHFPMGVLMLFVITVSIALLFFLPYVLWVRQTVSNYGTASTFALLLAGAGVVSGAIYMNERFPARKKKKKNDELDGEKPKNDDLPPDADELTLA